MAQQRPSSYFSPPIVPDLQDPTASDVLRDHGARVSEFAAASQRDANALFRGLQNLSAGVCDFRLTLTTGTPVTTSAVSGATTLYFTPYKGNRIGLYNGTNWNVRNSAEMSIAVPASTSQMYDVFCYDKAGVPTLELLAWTNDTTRATALVLQNGVLVKTGNTTRRYIGSFRTAGVSGTTKDTNAQRYVWNYYNRVYRDLRQPISSTAYNYTTLTFRQAAGSAANQLDYVIGVSEEPVFAEVIGTVRNTSAGVLVQVAIGLDGVTASPGSQAGFTYADGGVVLTAAQAQAARCTYLAPIPAGRHTLVWQEQSAATGTTTWNDSSVNCIQGYLYG